MKSILGLAEDIKAAIEKKGAATDAEKELFASLEMFRCNVVSAQEASKLPGNIDNMSVRQLKQALLTATTDIMSMASLLNEQTAIINKLTVYSDMYFVRRYAELSKQLRDCKSGERFKHMLTTFNEEVRDPFFPVDLAQKLTVQAAEKMAELCVEPTSPVSARKLED